MRKSTKKLQRSREVIKYTGNDKKFIDFVKSECKEYGVKCDLRPTKYVNVEGIKCSGYFCSEDKVLVCSMNRGDALEILVHEYCHLTQWKDNIPLWKVTHTSGVLMDRWLHGDPVRNITKHVGAMRDLELDNERRAVKLIKKWNLKIDIGLYIKKANAYVHFYNWLLHTRKWSSPNNAPYSNEHILSKMSDKFNMKYDDMSEKVLQAFIAEQI